MSKVSRLERQFSNSFRERFVPPKFDSIATYGSEYLGTFYPKTTEEVSDILKYCTSEKIAVYQNQKEAKLFLDKRFVIIKLDKMNEIEISEEDRTVLVNTGVEVGELLGFLEYKRFNIPCLSKFHEQVLLDILNDFSLNQTMSYSYGSLASFILGVEGVLGNGDIVRLGSSSYQSSFSEFLKQTMLNTQGLYGIITKVRIKLFPLILSQGIFTVEMHNLDVGVRILQKLIRDSITVEDIIFFNEASLKKLAAYKRLAISKEDTPYLLLFKVNSFSLESLSLLMEKIRYILGEAIDGIISMEYTMLLDEVERKLAWKEELSIAIKHTSFHQRIETLVLMPSKIENFINDLEYIQRDFGIELHVSGSLADGLVHVNISNIQDETGLVWMTFQHEIRAKILDVLRVYEGYPLSYFSDEQETIEQYFIGHSAYNLAQKVKEMCDPNNILLATNLIEDTGL